MKTTEFHKIIWNYYEINRRKLPWRETSDPYKIFISEVMLQQTQVPRVWVKYPEFIHAFPTFRALAKAPFEAVLGQWQGLGYNRRALYLQQSAQQVVEAYNGVLPSDEVALEMLPGIGPATARSIVVFAFNKPLVFIETNIRRVFIHHYFREGHSEQSEESLANASSQTSLEIPSLPAGRQGSKRVLANARTIEGVDDKQLFPLIEQTLDRRNPREWYYALMDYGSMLGKTIENPNRKSRHYTKQSKFEGSIRQVRGQILKLLLQNKTMNRQELETLFKTDSVRFSKALGQLEQEGFIVGDETLQLKS